MSRREFSITREIHQHRFVKDFPGYRLYAVSPQTAGMSSRKPAVQYIMTREDLATLSTLWINEKDELTTNDSVGQYYSGDFIHFYQPEHRLSKVFKIVDVIVDSPLEPKMKFKDGDIDLRANRLYVAKRDCGDYPMQLAKIFSTQAFQLQDTIPVNEICPLRPRYVSEPVEYYQHDEKAYIERLWRAHKAGM